MVGTALRCAGGEVLRVERAFAHPTPNERSARYCIPAAFRYCSSTNRSAAGSGALSSPV
jgi:hypothetical protein